MIYDFFSDTLPFLVLGFRSGTNHDLAQAIISGGVLVGYSPVNQHTL